MTDLSGLLKRVEGATGPDRELDRLIHVTLFKWRLGKIPPDVNGENECEIYMPPEGISRGFSYPPKGAVGIYYHVPQRGYTASIDAAVALVEEVLPGWDWGRDISGYIFLCETDWPDGATGPRMTSGFNESPALALCAALLKAKMDMDDA